MKHLPLGLKLIFLMLVLPVLIGYSMVIGTFRLYHSPVEKKEVVLQMEKYKIRDIDTVQKLDVFLEGELKTFLGSRWLAISLVQVVMAFGLVFRARWVRIGMIVYLSMLLLLQGFSIFIQPLHTQSFWIFKIISLIAGLGAILYLQHPKTKDEFY